jgi:hypothetical protein
MRGLGNKALLRLSALCFALAMVGLVHFGTKVSVCLRRPRVDAGGFSVLERTEKARGAARPGVPNQAGMELTCDWAGGGTG